MLLVRQGYCLIVLVFHAGFSADASYCCLQAEGAEAGGGAEGAAGGGGGQVRILLLLDCIGVPSRV